MLCMHAMYVCVKTHRHICESTCMNEQQPHCLFNILLYKCSCKYFLGNDPDPFKVWDWPVQCCVYVCVHACRREPADSCVCVCVLVLVVEEEGWWRFLIYRPQAAFEALISSHHIVLAHPLVQQGAENSPCNTVPSRSLSLTLSPPLPPPPSLTLSPTSHLPVPELWQPATALCLLGEEIERGKGQAGRWKIEKDRQREGERQDWHMDRGWWRRPAPSISTFWVCLRSKEQLPIKKTHTSTFPSRLASLWLLLFVNVFFFEYL